MMYKWRSKFLEDYASGDIVVSAPAVEEARALARPPLEAYLAEYYDWLNPEDEDDAERLAELRAKYEADLAAEPEVSNVFLIRGSA